MRFYRYGFQGQEKDDEIKGEGNSLNYTFRMHDPRVGRFFARDPLAPEYPHNSPYAFSENSTIAFVELEGLEKFFASTGELIGSYGTSSIIKVVNDSEVEQTRKILNSTMDKEFKGTYASYLIYHKSINYSQASAEVQSKITSSIYRNNVQENIRLKNVDINPVRLGDTGASTTGPGSFIIYPFLQQNETYVNDDYYNQINLFYHEEQHNKAIVNKHPTLMDDDFSHFLITKMQIEHPSWVLGTEALHKYIEKVQIGYLQGQEYYLDGKIVYTESIEELENNYNDSFFQSLVKEYEGNADFHNKTFAKNRRKYDTKQVYERHKETLSKAKE